MHGYRFMIGYLRCVFLYYVCLSLYLCVCVFVYCVSCLFLCVFLYRVFVCVCVFICVSLLASFYVSLTQNRIIWEEGTATGKMSLPDCPMSFKSAVQWVLD